MEVQIDSPDTRSNLMAKDSWKEWFASRTAGMIIKPGGESTYIAAHNTSINEGKAILHPMLAVEYRGQGMGAVEASTAAYEYVQRFNESNYTTLNMELVRRGCVIIDDSAEAVSSFGGASIFALDIGRILKNEEAISATIAKMPVALLYHGSGVQGPIMMDKVDLEETTSFTEAIEHAKARASGKAPAAQEPTEEGNSPESGGGPINVSESFDMGMWAKSVNRVISFFR
jgi:hypothetical protein